MGTTIPFDAQFNRRDIPAERVFTGSTDTYKLIIKNKKFWEELFAYLL
jgi:hypothetical protein